MGISGRPLGTLYVELDLDPSRYMKSQRTLLQEAQKASSVIEKSFYNIGIKSGETFDLIGAQAAKSYEKIIGYAESSYSTIVATQSAAYAKIMVQDMQRQASGEALWRNLGIRSAEAIELEKIQVTNSYNYIKAFQAKTAEDMINIEVAKTAKILALDKELNAGKKALAAEAVAVAVEAQKGEAALWSYYTAIYQAEISERVASSKIANEKMLLDTKAKAQGEAAQWAYETEMYTANIAGMVAESRRANEIQAGHWTNLGIRSTAVIEKQKSEVMASFAAIQSQTVKGSQDWINIERAKNDKLKQLNKEMVGDHDVSMAAMMRGVLRLYAAYYVFQMAGQFLATPFIKGFEAVENYRQSVASLAAMVMTFSERQVGQSQADQWQQALMYSTKMIPILENIAAKTLLSGQETIALANAFARSGVFLDASNKKQVESFTRISNALPLMTQGQEIMKQINTEIRSVMTGANTQSSMLYQSLRAIDPALKEHLLLWRAQGTVLEHIGEMLSGFGPATKLLENTWQTVKSTLDTTITQVLRGGMVPVYDDIIKKAGEINEYLKEHKDLVAGYINVAWISVKDIIQSVANLISTLGPLSRDAGDTTGIVAGWGLIFAAIAPITQLFKNWIMLTYDWIKMEVQGAQTLNYVLTGRLGKAKESWLDATATYEEVVELGRESAGLLTGGIADNMGRYALALENASAAQKKLIEGASILEQNRTLNYTPPPAKTVGSIIQDEINKTQGALDKLNSATREGMLQARSDQIESFQAMSKGHYDEMKIATYAAVSLAEINQKFHKQTEKDARQAASIENQVLQKREQTYKKMYDTELQEAEIVAQKQQELGQYEQYTTDELYINKQLALNEWYDRQSSVIEQEVKDQKIKNEKLNALQAEYDDKWAKNERWEVDTTAANAKKEVQVMASMYATVNQFSDEAVAAEIANIHQIYTVKRRDAAQDVKSQKVLADAEAQDKLNALNKNNSAIVNAYHQTALYAEKYYASIDALADAEAKKVKDATGSDVAAARAKYDFLLRERVKQIDSIKAVRDFEIDSSYKIAVDNGETVEIMRTAWNKYHNDMMTGAQIEGQMMLDMFNTVQSGAQSILVEGMQGHFKKIGDMWKALWTNMISVFLNAVAKIVTQEIMVNIGYNVVGNAATSAGASAGGTYAGNLLSSGGAGAYSYFSGGTTAAAGFGAGGVGVGLAGEGAAFWEAGADSTGIASSEATLATSAAQASTGLSTLAASISPVTVAFLGLAGVAAAATASYYVGGGLGSMLGKNPVTAGQNTLTGAAIGTVLLGLGLGTTIGGAVGLLTTGHKPVTRTYTGINTAYNTATPTGNPEFPGTSTAEGLTASFSSGQGTHELVNANTTLQKYQDFLKNLPAWVDTKKIMGEVTEPLTEAYQDITLKTHNWQSAIGSIDEAMNKTLTDNEQAWQDALVAYYNDLATQTKTAFTTAMGDAFKATDIITAADDFTNSMNKSMYDSVLSGIEDAMTSSDIYQQALTPFLDTVHTALTKSMEGALPAVYDSTGKMTKAAISGVFNPALFKSLIDQPLADAKVNIESLLPAFKDVYTVVGSIGDELGQTSAAVSASLSNVSTVEGDGIAAAFKSVDVETGMKAFTDDLDTSIYNSVVTSITNGLLASDLYKNALAPFLDVLNSSVTTAMSSGTFDTKLFTSLIEQPMATARANLKALMPAFKDVFTMVGSIGDELGITSAATLAATDQATKAATEYWTGLASSTAGVFSSAIAAGFTSGKVADGLQALRKGMYDKISGAMIDALANSAAVQSAITPFLDSMNSAIASSTKNNVFSVSQFTALMSGPISKLDRQLNNLAPVFTLVYTTLDKIKTRLGVVDTSTASVESNINYDYVTSATGNVFHNSTLVPFAKGDIFDTPTVFPMAQGKRGLLGEAGTEVIMPVTMNDLGRQSNGKLGIKEKKGTVSKVEAHFHVHGTVIDKAALNEFADKIYPRMEQLRVWKH